MSPKPSASKSINNLRSLKLSWRTSRVLWTNSDLLPFVSPDFSSFWSRSWMSILCINTHLSSIKWSSRELLTTETPLKRERETKRWSSSLKSSLNSCMKTFADHCLRKISSYSHSSCVFRSWMSHQMIILIRLKLDSLWQVDPGLTWNDQIQLEIVGGCLTRFGLLFFNLMMNSQKHSRVSVKTSRTILMNGKEFTVFKSLKARKPTGLLHSQT